MTIHNPLKRPCEYGDVRMTPEIRDGGGGVAERQFVTQFKYLSGEIAMTRAAICSAVRTNAECGAAHAPCPLFKSSETTVITSTF